MTGLSIDQLEEQVRRVLCCCGLEACDQALAAVSELATAAREVVALREALREIDATPPGYFTSSSSVGAFRRIQATARAALASSAASQEGAQT